MTPDFMESPLSQIPPADPTPSAAVAPTGGETVTRYDLCCGEESAWMEPGPTGAYVLFEDVRAALSSPVRAEPTGYSGSTGEALDVLATAERHIPEAERGYYILAIDTLRSWVRAERGEAERLRQAVDVLRDRVACSATQDGAAPKLRDALIGFNIDPVFYTRWERNRVALVDVLDALDAALTPTPPATPTEPTDA